MIKQVSKSFVRKPEVGASRRKERREVLKDVNLELEEGEVVCVLGKNGSGKTTLIRVLSGLLEPDTGKVRICGFDVSKVPNEVRKRIGVMLHPGEGGFHPRLSGSKSLEYFAALYQIPVARARIRIRYLLSVLGLEDRGADQFQSYSSGLRRRVALARALLSDAPVLFLDEPTVGIDPWSTEQIHKFMVDLSSQGKTILCTTNNRMEASVLGGSAYTIDGGRLSRLELTQEDSS